MYKKLGQADSEWRTQIKQLPAIRNLWGKKKRQAIEMVMHYLGFSTELGAILKDVEFIVDTKDGKWVNYHLNTEAEAQHISQLIPLLKEWLPDDQTVNADKLKVIDTHREFICGIS